MGWKANAVSGGSVVEWRWRRAACGKESGESLQRGSLEAGLGDFLAGPACVPLLITDRNSPPEELVSGEERLKVAGLAVPGGGLVARQRPVAQQPQLLQVEHPQRCVEGRVQLRRLSAQGGAHNVTRACDAHGWGGRGKSCDDTGLRQHRWQQLNTNDTCCEASGKSAMLTLPARICSQAASLAVGATLAKVARALRHSASHLAPKPTTQLPPSISSA